MVSRVGNANTRLSRSAERLATGKRLNRAADDGAGTAQAARFRARARSLEQTVRNIREGRSLLEAVDTALDDITGRLHRIRELAVRAASDAMLHRDRLKLDNEAQHHLDEIERRAEETELASGKPLVPNEVDWVPPTIDVGVVVDVSGSMGPYFAPLRAGLSAFVSRMASASVETNLGVARIGNREDAADAALRVSDIGEDATAALAGLNTVGQSMDTYSSLMNLSGANDRPGAADPDAFTWTGAEDRHLIVLTDTRAQEVNLAGDTEGGTAVALNDLGIQTHVIGAAARQGDFNGITGATGSWQELGAAGANIDAALTALGDGILNVQDTPPEPVYVEVQGGVDPGEAFDLELPVDATIEGLGLDELHLVTKLGANDALDDTATALEQVLTHRGSVGAKMNRLTHAESVQKGVHLATEASRGRLEDADMASEARDYFGRQTKLQAASAVFARMQQLERSQAEAMTATLGGARLVNATA